MNPRPAQFARSCIQLTGERSGSAQRFGAAPFLVPLWGQPLNVNGSFDAQPLRQVSSVVVPGQLCSRVSSRVWRLPRRRHRTRRYCGFPPNIASRRPLPESDINPVNRRCLVCSCLALITQKLAIRR